MNLALSFAEARRAAGIATPMLAPIVLELPPLTTGPRRSSKTVDRPLRVEPPREAQSAITEPAHVELTAEQRTTWEAHLDRYVTEIMGPRYPLPVDPEEPHTLLAALEAAAGLCEFVLRARTSQPVEASPPKPPEPPRPATSKGADKASPTTKAESPPPRPPTILPPVPVDAVENAEDRFRCVPYGAVLFARSCLARQEMLGKPRTPKSEDYFRCEGCEDGLSILLRLRPKPKETP